jgi:hypothetical protein
MESLGKRNTTKEAAPCSRYCGLVRMARWSRVAPQGCQAYQALDARVALIQALIPVGLQAVEDALQQEVSGPGWSPVCAPRWEHRRWCGGGPAAGIGLPGGPEAAGTGVLHPEPVGRGRSPPAELPPVAAAPGGG